MSGCASLYPEGIPDTPGEPPEVIVDTTPIETIRSAGYCFHAT